MQRFLSNTLKTFLDAEVLPTTDPHKMILDAAFACVGIQEEGGDNRGKMVESFQATIGGANGEAWCLSFIQSLIAYVEDRLGLVCNLPLTEHVLTLWDRAPKTCRILEPDVRPGDLILWRYGTTTKGHIGIITQIHYKVVDTIEGNTSPRGIVEREGDGVYIKQRAIKGTSLMHIQGFIRPGFSSLLGEVPSRAS